MFREEQVEVLDVVLSKQRAKLAVLDVPLVELVRERLLELPNVRLDTRGIRVFMWGIYLPLVAQRREATEVVVLLC